MNPAMDARLWPARRDRPQGLIHKVVYIYLYILICKRLYRLMVPVPWDLFPCSFVLGFGLTKMYMRKFNFSNNVYSTSPGFHCLASLRN